MPNVLLAERTALETIQVTAWGERSGQVCERITAVLGVRPPPEPNRVSRTEQARAMWLGPFRWLFVTATGNQRDLASVLTATLDPSTAAVVEAGGARRVFRLAGPLARDVLAKHVPLDLSESKFPLNSCAQCAIAGVSVLVHAASDQTFEIFAYRSFAQHLWEVLVDSAGEFGLEL